MKTLIISMLILLITFFGLIPAFGQPPDESPPQLTEQINQKEEPVNEPEHKKISDADAAADPNRVVRARIKKFEGLGKALEEINAESGNEIRQWTRKTEDKLDLALEVQKQITAELNFLRELAVKEGSSKTTVAIDGILLDRQERFKEVIEKLKKDSAREQERLRRRAEREERKSKEQERLRERNSRERSRERADRNRGDTQP